MSLKRTLLSFFLVLCFSKSAFAQMDSGKARIMSERIRQMTARMNETPPPPPPSFGAPAPTPEENLFVNTVFPELERQLLDIQDLFDRASVTLPSEEGQRCYRDACNKLQQALGQVILGLRIIQDSTWLGGYFIGIITDFERDINQTVIDAECNNLGQTNIGSLDNGTYVLKAKHSLSCLTVPDNGNADGVPLQQQQCNYQDGQKFYLEKQSSGLYMLKGDRTRRCVSSQEWKIEDGNPMIQWQCLGGDDQLVSIERLGNGHTVKFKNSGKCMDVQYYDKENGRIIHQYPCTGNDDQTWIFERLK